MYTIYINKLHICCTFLDPMWGVIIFSNRENMKKTSYITIHTAEKLNVKFCLYFNKDQWYDRYLCSVCNCRWYNRTAWSFQFSEILCNQFYSQMESCLPIFLVLIRSCIKVKSNLLMEAKDLLHIALSLMNNACIAHIFFSPVCSCREVMNRKKKK